MSLHDRPALKPILLFPVMISELLLLASFVLSGTYIVDSDLWLALVPQFSVGFVSFIELFEVDFASMSGALISVASLIVIFPLSAFLMGGFIHLMADTWRNEEHLTLRHFFTNASRLFWKVVLFNLLFVAIVFGLAFIAGIAIAVMGLVGGTTGIVISSIVIGITGFTLRLLFLYLEFTVVLTDSTVTESFRDSFHIRKDGHVRYMPIVLIMFAVSIVTTLIIYGLSLPIWALVIIGIIYILAMIRIQISLMQTFLLNKEGEQDNTVV